MKKLIDHKILVLISLLLIIILISGSGCKEFPKKTPERPGTYWYYADGEQVVLPFSREEVAIRFREGLRTSKKADILVDAASEDKLLETTELEEPELTIIRLRLGLDETDFRKILQDLRKKRDVVSAYPVFPFPDGRQTLTDQFVARFKPGTSEESIDSFNDKHKVEIVREMHLTNTYLLKVEAGDDSLAMANTYHESDLTAYATPDFVRFLKPQFSPDDPHYPNQWGMENDGTNPPDGVGIADSDIDASKAWDISTGNPETIIAIIDEGVELDHEDLVGKIVAEYSAIPDDEDGGPNNDVDAHGTNCAGIAAASTNNTLGVAGICPDCSLMSAQIAYSRFNGSFWITKDSWIADAIIWAVDNGADVLSNSWGGGSSSTLINDAITYAVTNGRGGLGSLVLFAAGNSDSAIIYPATNENVIAVGAASPCDERKNPTSCDGENWGSCYGPELDIVSPGVEWWSTDLMGSAGYVEGNYFDHMNGTSSATPAASGLAGLIISYAPCLTGAQVREILQQSAEDLVGPPEEDLPGWDEYMGWGRINANDALLLAAEYICPEETQETSDIYIPGINQ